MRNWKTPLLVFCSKAILPDLAIPVLDRKIEVRT
jgi:hypothetical protein